MFISINGSTFYVTGESDILQLCASLRILQAFMLYEQRRAA